MVLSVQQHAVVVGAGIAGLGTAVGLRRAGWRVTVLERTTEIAPVGAGISMYPNAIRALRALGLDSQLDALPKLNLGHGIRTPKGRWLTRVDGPTVEKLWGGEIVGLHRADLHALLRSALPADSIRLGVPVTSAQKGPDGRWVVRGPDAVEVDDADVVVAGDGIESRLRAQYWPDLPRAAYTGSTAWRGIAPMQPKQELYGVQTFGPGAEFGLLPLTNGDVYWYASAATPPGVRHADERAAVLARYADWHAPIPRLIESSDVVMHHDIFALPTVPSSLVHERVVLVGDAGHGMTPHLGQGGCTALEDAAVLAAELGRTPDDIPAALARYDLQRQPRVSELARIAEGIRQASHEAGRLAAFMRNLSMPFSSPARVYQVSTDAADWQPPSIAEVRI
ncbi:FAD-dependent oxidoreductase [Nocardia sp. R6R-6]|uniref:FAD-dependent oxidoreductase n=1 Tax=Nocardia sp. R6R-6 TaxID=3459303 RepID=UPI00403DA7BC